MVGIKCEDPLPCNEWSHGNTVLPIVKVSGCIRTARSEQRVIATARDAVCPGIEDLQRRNIRSTVTKDAG